MRAPLLRTTTFGTTRSTSPRQTPSSGKARNSQAPHYRNAGAKLKAPTYAAIAKPFSKLCVEHIEAVRAMRQKHLDWLKHQGVTAQGLINADLVGVDQVRFEGGSYVPEDGGAVALINPVYEGDELVDLCAWLPRAITVRPQAECRPWPWRCRNRSSSKSLRDTEYGTLGIW